MLVRPTPKDFAAGRAQDVPLAVQLPLRRVELSDPRPQPGELLIERLAVGRWTAPVARGPEAQRHPAALNHADNVVSMPPRSAAIPTTVALGVARYSSNRVPAKLLRVRLPRHRLIFSPSPGPAWIQ
jgi:hypothetical protein